MSFVERVSDRVGIMRAGKLVAEASPAELRRATGLRDAPFEDVFFHLIS
jgi:ABC-type multidrug transport system ATPase subunit